MWASSSVSPRTRLPRSASRKDSGKISSRERPRTSSRRAAVQRLHRPVPAGDPSFEVEDQDPRVHAFEDVLVVLRQSLELVGLLLKAPVEPAVHEGRGRLSGEGLEQVHLLAVQGIEALLAADAEDRDHLALGAAGEVVGEVEGPGFGERFAPGLRRSPGLPGQADRGARPGQAAAPSRLRGAAQRPEDRRRNRGRRGGTRPSTRRRGRRWSAPADARRCGPGRGRRSGPGKGEAAPGASRSAPCRRAGRCPPGSGSSPG